MTGAPHGEGEGRAVSEGRVQTSLLAGPERRALLWIAVRLPRWMGPDSLTFIGLAALAGVAAAYYCAGRYPHHRTAGLIAASCGLVLNWFGDSLDGTLARVRNRQRPMYGYYLDHLVDAFGVSMVLGGIAFSGLTWAPLGVALLALYLIASINAYLAAHTVGVFKISFARISPTEGRLILIVLNIVLIFVERVRLFGMDVRLPDLIFVSGGAVLLFLTLRSAALTLSKLDRAERAKWPRTAPGGPKTPSPEAG